MADQNGNGNGHAVIDGIPRSFVGDFGPRELASLGRSASPQTRAGVYPADIGMELGRSGLRHWGGFVFEEWLNQLQQGQQAAQVYRDMMDSDPIVGAIMYAIQHLMRRVTWWTEPGEATAGSSKRDAQQGADWFEGVRNDMQFSWADTVSEIISFLGYGWSYPEIVYKQRNGENALNEVANSEYDDGTIAPAKLPIRSQDSIWKWVFDDVGDIEGMIQNPPPDYLLRYIPLEKALHFRTTIYKNNPLGRSILRTSYQPWYFAKNMRAIEGIGVERDLAGLPVLQPPEGVDIWDTRDPAMVGVRAAAQNIVSSIRRDEQEGVILPAGWELSLLTTGGSRQFDTGKIISRYETRIATSVLADLVMMGQDKVGSYALAVTKKDLFSASLGAYLDIIASQFNTRLIPRLWRLNGFKGPRPKLCHGQVETIDLDTLGNYIMRLGQSGAPIDWSTILPWANDQAGMPQPKPGHDFSPRNIAQTVSDKGPSDRLVAKEDEDGEDE
jgi:hypothetical protein